MRSRCRSASRRSRSLERVGAREAEVRALTVLGGDLAYLGRGEEGLAHLRQALQLAEEIGDHLGLERAYVNSHRRADDAGTAARVGATGPGGARRDAPRTGSTAPCSSRTRSRRCSRSATGTRPNGSAPPRSARITVELPVPAPHHPRRRRDRPRRVRRRARAPRGRARHPARGPRAGPLRRLPRRARAVGAPLGGRRRRPCTTVWRGRARARPRRSASGSAPRDCAHRRSWRRSHAPAATPTPSATGSAGPGSCSPPLAAPPRRPRRSRRTPPAGSRWPRPSTSAPAACARPGAWSEAAAALGAARAPAARGLLPLAPGRGARRRRRLPRRGERAAQGGACRRSADRSKTPAAGARAARRNARGSISAPPDTAHRDAKQGLEELLGLTPREAEVLTLVARGLHQPRDRRGARHQRQDGQRPRLAHPAQARRAEPARSRRDRAPHRPTGVATCPSSGTRSRRRASSRSRSSRRPTGGTRPRPRRRRRRCGGGAALARRTSTPSSEKPAIERAASVRTGPAEMALTRMSFSPRSQARYLTDASSVAFATPMTL